MRRYIANKFSIAIVVLIGVLIGVLAGCAKSPIGVFESIELEREIIDDRALGNELLVGAVAESGGRYFIAAATLWHREVADADYPAEVAQWASVGSPGSANFTTSSLAVFNGSGTELIYASYSSQDGTTGGIYAIDPTGDLGPVTTDDNVFGTESADVAGVGQVFVGDDGIATYLLVGVRKPSTSRYTVYASTTGGADSFVEVVGIESNLPTIDVAVSATGAVAFLTRKALLIDGDGLNTGTGPTDVTASLGIVDRQPAFGGVYFQSATDTLWVTDNEGYLYHSPDFGATWDPPNGTAHPVSTSDEDPLPFTDMTAVNNGGTELLVVGTEGHGYRELDIDFNPTTPAAEGSNYQASELALATILTFYVDEDSTVSVPAQTGETYELKTGDLLFAGTSNLGLWKVLYSGDPPQWVRE